MKTLFRRSLTTFLCVGSLFAGTQSWAAEAKQTSTVSTAVQADIKEQGKCQKPCDMKNDKTTQQDHSQHDHSKMSDMSQMDHSKMMNMDPSKMGNMDHSNMMNMDHSKMGDMDHSKMNMSTN